MSVNERLTWADYPAPRVKKIKNKYSIVVSVPRGIRHLFGTPEVAKATGTIDRAIAEKKLIPFGNKLYAKLDQKQVEAEQVTDDELDGFAVQAINRLAKAFKYNGGLIPKLDATTDFDELQKLKLRLDAYSEMEVDEDAPMQRINRAGLILREAESAGVNMADKSTPDWAVWNKKILAEIDTKVGLFSNEQRALAELYSSNVVQSYFQDLLTKAAQEQGVREPDFDTPSGQKLVKVRGKIIPTHLAEYLNAGNQRSGLPPEEAMALERTRRVQSNDALLISDVRTEYVTYVETRHEKVNTQRKWIRAIDRFIELIGDLPLSEIKPLAAYQFAQKQEDAKPTVSNKSVTDYHTGVSLFLKYCVRKGYVEMNSFQGVSVKEYGKPKQGWLDYTPNDLDRIFAYDWDPQERLLLNILLSTGMRATEAGSLTWERFNDTEVAGVRYFSLIDTNDEQVEVKNIGSARYIPLHPDLMLPPKGEGRLFNYTIDDNGLCSSSIGHIINPILNQFAPHKRKLAHSFRGTLKVMLRDAGVSKEINDIYTGHGSGDVSGTAYGGASIETRAEAIAKAKIPWLKQQ